MPVPERPNLLFVFSDQHRWCDLGCYGNPQVHTPALDSFAWRALRFENCISNAPVCVPARGTLLTGRYPLGHGALTNDLPMHHGVPSIADVLAAAGYHTGYIGKWHLAGVPRDQFVPAGPGRFGFREWKVCNCNHAYFNAYYFDEENRRVPVEGYEPMAQTHLAIDFIHRNREIPWCLFLSWGPPHDPYHAVPDAYLQRYRERELHLRPNVPDQILLARNRYLSREEIRERTRGYYAHITALDEQFGRLLEALFRSGQLDRTIVVYTSDHGDMLGSQGLTNKQLPYDESVKVPLLIAWQGHTRRGVTFEPIGLVDLPVSLLGLMGLSFPNPVDGIDLHHLFTDPGARGRDECYIFDLIPCHQAAARGDREWRGVRTRSHTFARTASDEGYVLFDNLSDPYQRRNLIGDPAAREIHGELLARTNALAQQHDRLLPWEDFLREFGYVEAWNRSQAYFRLPLLAP
ncbi:MAG: sulfatase [Armatimonadota bacterium]|nr:sulfatase [Armatimonadota bacterium]